MDKFSTSNVNLLANLIFNDTDEYLDIHGVSDNEVIPLIRVPIGERQPIRFSDTMEIPRDILLSYLYTCSRIILSSTGMDEIFSDYKSQSNFGLHDIAVKYQQDILEYNFNIEKKYGCKILSQIPSLYPNDLELQDAALSFIYSAMKSYLKMLLLRHQSLHMSSNKFPIISGELSRVTIMEFFEGCNALMAIKSVKLYLIQQYEANNNKIANDKIILLQKQILSSIGYEAEYAISQLNQVSRTYAQDYELMMKMQYFAICAQVSAK